MAMVPELRTLIDATTLAAYLEAPELRVFDCRFDLARPDYGARAYAEEHIPGAVYADLNRDLSAPVRSGSGRHPLPDPGEFGARLREWGVNQDSAVVAYDDNSGMYASRLWWMLRWLGHRNVAVLEGGLRSWRRLDLPLTEELHVPVPGNFQARPQPGHIATADAVARAAGGEVLVLDARAPERYRGEVEPIDRVAGHVPGARNHHYERSLGADGGFLPQDALRPGLLASLAGASPEDAVIMCGSGVSACHLLLAMDHAGLRGARLYPGSWSEWSSDPARPVRTGDLP